MILKYGITLLSLMVSTINALTLDDVLKSAIAINPEIKEKTKRYNEIYYDVEIAKAGYLPKMDLTANSRLHDSRIRTFADRRWDGQLSVTQNLFNGFGDVSKHDLELSKYESAFYTTQELTNSFSLEVIKLYMSLLRDKELLAIQQSSVDNHENILNKITKKYNVGLGNKLELSLSRTSLYMAKINYLEQQNALQQSVINLEKYLDHRVDPQSLVYPDERVKVPSNVDEALEIAFKSHPSMQVSSLNKKMTDFEVDYTKKDLYPSLDLKGEYTNGEKGVYPPDQFDYYKVGLMLTYNLYNGSADINAKRKMLEKVSQKDALIHKTKRDITHKVKSQYDIHVMTHQKMEFLEGYVKSKELALENFYAHFLIGKANLRDILDTTESLYAAKKMLLDGKIALLMSKYSILEAMGVLPEITYSDYVPELPKAKPFVMPFAEDTYDTEAIKKYSDRSFDTTELEEEKQISENCYVVEATILNIREAKNTQSNILGTYQKGDIICAEKNDINWMKTKDGWVLKQYLTGKK